MEDVKKPSPLPAVLGVTGFVLALLSIAVGAMAVMKVQEGADELNGKIERAAALSLEMKKLSERIDSAVAQIENVKASDGSRVDALSKQTKTALENVARALNDNRNLIEENRKAIQEVAQAAARRSQPAQAAAPAASQQASAAPSGTTTSSDASGAKIHKIKSGDSFSKLAQVYGVTIEAIQAANPSLDSARLKIGQDVVIPSK